MNTPAVCPTCHRRFPKPKEYRLLTANGKTQTLAAWVRETGLDKRTITSRIDRHGWSEQRALTTPARKKKGANTNQ
jgi:hypothetical protein